MKYIGDLISEIRRDTNNTDFSSTSGISTEDFLRYSNWGQEMLQGLILQSTPMTFIAEKEISVQANVEAYTIPDNVYLGERIVNVEYTFTGESKDYYKLPEEMLSTRRNYPQNYPTSYLRRNGQIILQPPPTSTQGKLRVNYERQLDRLDTRRGTVSAATVSGALAVTSITVDIASVSTDDIANFSTAQYICINDREGNVLAYNIPVSGYNSGTGGITILGGTFTLQTGETIPVGSFVTIGKYTTTHSKLKDMCERFIQAYCGWKILGRDSSSGSKLDIASNELKMMKEEIITSYQEPDKDYDDISIVNNSIMLRSY